MGRLKDAGRFKFRYQTPKDSIHEDFINPCLSCAKLYQQQSAYLSAETFRMIRRGIVNLLEKKEE